MKTYDARGLQAEQYIPLVKQIANSMRFRVPHSIAFSDLMGQGLLGLVEAHVHFDSTRGVPFEAYARVRIKGAMLDLVRQECRATCFAVPYYEEEHWTHDDPVAARASARQRLSLVQKTIAPLGTNVCNVMERVSQGCSLAQTARELNIHDRKAARLRDKAMARLRRAAC